MPLADAPTIPQNKYSEAEWNLLTKAPPGYPGGDQAWSQYNATNGYDLKLASDTARSAGYVWGEKTGYESIATAANRAAYEKAYAAQVSATSKAEAEAARARAEESRRLRASLTFEMKAGTYAMPFDVSKYINATVSKKGNLEMMLNMIFADKRFKKAFPGLLDKNGDLKMTPAEYKQRRTEAASAFAQAGFKLSDAQFGDLMGKDVSPNEIQFRAQSAQFIKNNADVLIAVKQQVADLNAGRKAKGLPPLPGLNNMSDVMKFVTKQQSKELYATVEAGTISAAAKRAGLQLTGARARQLAGAGVGLESIEDAEGKFKNIANNLRSAGVELGAMGLDQKKLETIEFGGEGRLALAAQAEQALRNVQSQRETEVSGAQSELKGGRPVTTGASQATL